MKNKHEQLLREAHTVLDTSDFNICFFLTHLEIWRAIFQLSEIFMDIQDICSKGNYILFIFYLN